MPYKDIEKRNKASKDSMKRKRGINKEGVNIEMVPPSYVEGINGKMYEALPERPRYFELSEKQILDRLSELKEYISGDWKQRMQRCNESSYNYRPNESSKERVNG